MNAAHCVAIGRKAACGAWYRRIVGSDQFAWAVSCWEAAHKESAAGLACLVRLNFDLDLSQAKGRLLCGVYAAACVLMVSSVCDSTCCPVWGHLNWPRREVCVQLQCRC